jgi:hypothetical protein
MCKKGCVLLFLLLVICSSCVFTPSSTVVDPATLPDLQLFEPGCETACWRGLRPGETTVSELEVFFDDASLTNIRTSEYEQGDGYAVYFADDHEEYGISVITSNDVVLYIGLTSLTNLSLGHIIDTLGPPRYVDITYRTTEIRSLEAYLVINYPEDGFVFHVTNSGGIEIDQEVEDHVSICLDENNLVSWVQIVVPGSIDEVVGNLGYPIYPRTTGAALENFVNHLAATPWPGFSCIELP